MEKQLNSRFINKNASLGENYLNLCKSANNSEQETIKSLIKAIEEIINHQREEFKLEYSSDRHNQKKWFIINLKKLSDGDNQLVYMSFNHPKAIEVIQRFQEIDARRHFNQHNSSEYTLADTNVWGILNPVYQSLHKQIWQIMRQAELKVGREKDIEEQSWQNYEFMVEQIISYLSNYLNNHLELNPYIIHNQLNQKLETEFAYVKSLSS